MKTFHLKELYQAFENVDIVLRGAGRKGWEQVYKASMSVLESVMDIKEFWGGRLRF